MLRTPHGIVEIFLSLLKNGALKELEVAAEDNQRFQMHFLLVTFIAAFPKGWEFSRHQAEK